MVVGGFSGHMWVKTLESFVSKQVKRDGMKEESGGEAACATSALLIQPIGGNDLDGFVVLPVTAGGGSVL